MTRLAVVLTAVAVLAAAAPASPSRASRWSATPSIGPQSPTILVRVADGASRSGVHRRAGYTPVGRIGALNIDVVEVPGGDVTDALRAYRQQQHVVYAERNRTMALASRPDDHMFDGQYALRRIRAPKGWSRYGKAWRARGGARLAVIDSGIDRMHPEFAGKVTHCRNWLTGFAVGAPGCQDSQFHGTHVAGIAAATANNGTGIAGVAYDAEIMALQAFNSSGLAVMADIVAAIVYAAHNGADVANYSFSGPTDSRALRDAVAYAARRDVVQVGAAGNTGELGVEYPARLKRVIAVGATDLTDARAEFSTFGKPVEVAAPGEDILSVFPLGFYVEFSGTSMAAPHVAGLAALLRAEGYSPAQTRKRIRRGADDLGPPGRDRDFGFGLINVNRSLRP